MKHITGIGGSASKLEDEVLSAEVHDKCAKNNDREEYSLPVVKRTLYKSTWHKISTIFATQILNISRPLPCIDRPDS